MIVTSRTIVRENRLQPIPREMSGNRCHSDLSVTHNNFQMCLCRNTHLLHTTYPVCCSSLDYISKMLSPLVISLVLWFWKLSKRRMDSILAMLFYLW